MGRAVRRFVLVSSAMLVVGLASSGYALAGPARVLQWGSIPAPVEGLGEVKALGAGFNHQLAVLPDGSVYGWGSNLSGQLGRSPQEVPVTQTPVQAEGVSGAVAVAGGDRFSLALLEDGTVMAWGSNEGGSLGRGTGKEVFSPEPAVVPGVEHVKAIAADGEKALALLEDGTVMSWGAGGGLGAGHKGGPEPSPITGLSGVKAIATGKRFSLALLEDGTVESWGWTDDGELGNGNLGEEDRETPAPVPGLEHVKAISAAGDTATALLEDGTVKGWGDGQEEAFGTEAFVRYSTPTTIEGLSGVTAIATGYHFNLALLEDGSVKALGQHVRGNGGASLGGAPTPVCGAEGATLLAGNRGQVHTGETQHAYAAVPVNPLCLRVSELVYGYGSPGETITVSGTNLQEATSVLFGSTPAAFTTDSSERITATIPSGSGVTHVVVASAAHASAEDSLSLFAFTEPPSFGRCEAYGGIGVARFGDLNCQSPVDPMRTAFSWTPIYAGSFETSSSRPLKLETASHLKLACSAETGTGRFTGVKTLGEVVLTLTGCEGPGGRCSSAGQGEGTIGTAPLEGLLGVVTHAAEPVHDTLGLELAGQAPSREVAAFSCGGSTFTLRGGLIAQVVANVMPGKPFAPTKGKGQTISFVEKKGTQKPEAFSGAAPDPLESSMNGGAYERIGVKARLAVPRIEFSSTI